MHNTDKNMIRCSLRGISVKWRSKSRMKITVKENGVVEVGE